MTFEVHCPTTVKSVTNGTFETQNLKFQQKQNVMNLILERQNRKFSKIPQEIMDERNISELTS